MDGAMVGGRPGGSPWGPDALCALRALLFCVDWEQLVLTTVRKLPLARLPAKRVTIASQRGATFTVGSRRMLDGGWGFFAGRVRDR